MKSKVSSEELSELWKSMSGRCLLRALDLWAKRPQHIQVGNDVIVNMTKCLLYLSQIYDV